MRPEASERLGGREKTRIDEKRRDLGGRVRRFMGVCGKKWRNLKEFGCYSNVKVRRLHDEGSRPSVLFCDDVTCLHILMGRPRYKETLGGHEVTKQYNSIITQLRTFVHYNLIDRL